MSLQRFLALIVLCCVLFVVLSMLALVLSLLWPPMR